MATSDITIKAELERARAIYYQEVELYEYVNPFAEAYIVALEAVLGLLPEGHVTMDIVEAAQGEAWWGTHDGLERQDDGQG